LLAPVRKTIEAAGRRFFSLPPYSPDFNPIEQLLAKAQSAPAKGCRAIR